jgi:hypothetical protein
MDGRIYIHKNKVNGKCYVGQTTTKPKLRWGSNGSGYYKQPKFYNAIKLYGWNNFEHIILPTVYKTKDELNQAEIEVIKDLDSVDNGYNLSLGGQLNEKAKVKISVYYIDGTYIDTYDSLSIAMEKLKLKSKGVISSVLKGEKGRYGKYVFKYYENGDENINYKVEQRTHNIKVNQYTLDNTFIKQHDSIKEATKEVKGKSNSNITMVCKGQRKKAHGYIWSYAEVNE